MLYNPQLPEHRKTVETFISRLNKEIEVASKAYNARSGSVTILVNGIEANTGKAFSHVMTIGIKEDNIVRFFNDFGATQIAQRINLQTSLAKAVETIVPVE